MRNRKLARDKGDFTRESLSAELTALVRQFTESSPRAYNVRSLDYIFSSQTAVVEDEGEGGSEDDNPTAPQPVPRSVRALELLADAGISLSELIDDVFFGDKLARGHRKVMNARKEAYTSGVLPRVMEHICRPPDMRIRGVEHKNAINELKEWANETTIHTLRHELATHAKSTKAGDVEREVVNEESLKGLTFDAMADEIQKNTPKLYKTLSSICETTRQEQNKQKDSKFSITLMINALAFQLSNKSNQMQKLICIYLKAKGVPKSCFFFFQKAGLSLSYEWSRKALEQISATAMEEAAAIFDSDPCISIYDNIRLAQAVKHERMSHKTVTDNGTAMTIVPMRDSKRATALLRDPDKIDEHWNVITRRYHGGKAHDHQLKASDLYNHPGFANWGRRTTSNIIQFLYAIPGLEKSLKQKHQLLKPMDPIHQLPLTKDRFHMLEPVPMEEQSHTGNYGITKELPRQMKVDTDEKLINWARTRMGAWVGDSLTINRLRHLQRMKADDCNRLERMQHIIPVFGWMHLDMNLCNAIFYHHYGEKSNSGLGRDSTALTRQGLGQPTKSRGPAYHIVDEFIQHTTTARMRGLWLWVSGTTTTKELIEWEKKSTPEAIAQAAKRIWLERTSSRATEKFKSDSRLCNSITINRELLLRHEVKYSMRHGDVGRMEHALPHLLYFFSGAGCTNYAREIAEVLHWRMYEAPPGVADLIRDECWLINTLGRPDSFYALDLRQELNNLYIKEHGPPPQGCTWEAHRKWGPALPVFASVIQHMDENFHDFYRSRKHYVPDPEEDIALLIKRQAERRIHAETSARPVEATPEKRQKDCFELGRIKIDEKNYLGAVAHERIQYFANLSSLEIAKHDKRPIEEVVQLKRGEGMKAKGVTSQNTDNDTNADEMLGEDDEDLVYEYEKDDDEEYAEKEYEDIRHRLGDGLDG